MVPNSTQHSIWPKRVFSCLHRNKIAPLLQVRLPDNKTAIKRLDSKLSYTLLKGTLIPYKTRIKHRAVLLLMPREARRVNSLTSKIKEKHFRSLVRRNIEQVCHPDGIHLTLAIYEDD